jgi:hypothetical protein
MWRELSLRSSNAFPVMLNLIQHPFARPAQPFTRMDPETSSGCVARQHCGDKLSQFGEIMKRNLVVLLIAVAACQSGERQQAANERPGTAVNELELPTTKADGTPLTAAYCDTEEAARIYGNLKGCSMVACDQGDKESCEVARQFATQHAPPPSPAKLEGMDYNEARRAILAMGWVPLTGPCEGIMDDETCGRFTEIRNCSGTGLGFCDMHFERRNRCLTIITVGGYPDGEVNGEPSVRDVHFSRAPCRKDPNAQ